MLDMDIQKVVDLAMEYFPKSSDSDFRLLRKVIKPLGVDQAVDVLDQAKLGTRFLTLPLQEISKAVKATKKPVHGEYIPCYALALEGIKTIECNVLAQSDEGAKCEFAEYLTQHGYVPTDYALYIGVESFNRFFHDRYERACELNPQIRSNTEFLRSISEQKGVKGVLGALAGASASSRTPLSRFISTQNQLSRPDPTHGAPEDFEGLESLSGGEAEAEIKYTDDDIPF
jgi:hypothetical protein